MIKNINKIKLLKPENVFSSKTIHALYLVSASKITPEQTKLTLIVSVKEIYDHTNMHQIKYDKVSFLKANFSRLEKEYNEYIKIDQLQNYQKTVFTPSKLAINALNFIDRAEERKILKLENDEEIENIFKIIFILINREIPEDPMNYLFNRLIPRMKSKSLSISC